MISDSLITKYRPQSFDEVIGQDEVVRSLKQIVKKDTARTFLFIGPSGVGKTTLARLVAREVGCENTAIVEVDAATFTSIDDMRVLVETTRYRPITSISKKRAIIVDECHALSKAAIQSLLKALEEPPEWQYWMLATTEGGRILDTIKTRSAVFNLKPVFRNDLVVLLEYICGKEKFGVDADTIALCVKEADGSPRQAISNLAVCSAAKSRDEAGILLRSALVGEGAYELAQALSNNYPWDRLKEIILGMAEQNAESVRQVVRSYFTKAVLSDDRTSNWHLRILDEFSQPFPLGDGITPVLMAVAHLTLAKTV